MRADVSNKHLIYGVHITGRVVHVPEVQHVFTLFGCNIKTRLGLHEASDKDCSPNGLILLEMVGDDARCREMADRLRAIQGVEVKEMSFEHA